MTKKCTQLPDQQHGSVSLLVLLFGVMAIGICFGVVAVAETMTVKKEATLGAQSSANAAAFSYGHTFVKEVKQCYTKKVSEWLEEEPELPEECDTDLLDECLSKKFKQCDSEVLVCIPDSDEFIQSCTRDPQVIAASTDAAKSAASRVASNYQLDHFFVAKQDDTLKISGNRSFSSQVPVFGRNMELNVEAESETTLTLQGE